MKRPCVTLTTMLLAACGALPNGAPLDRAGGAGESAVAPPSGKFDLTPIKYRLPDRGTDWRGSWLSSGAELRDLDGDQKPELIATTESYDQPVYGHPTDSHWRIYQNNGATGFAATFAKWPVPNRTDPHPFSDRLDGLGFHAIGDWLDYQLFDLDGDGRSDLIHCSEPITDPYRLPKVFGIDQGAPYWRFYKNTGSGFSPLALQWPVPQGGMAQTDAAGNTYMVGYSRFFNRYYRLIDLNADGRVDFVSFAPESGPTVGRAHGGQSDPHWKVYLNQGNGFGPEVKWQVPGPQYFQDVGDSAAPYDLADINNDGTLDLIVTRPDPPTYQGPKRPRVFIDPATGRPHWQVYLNDGSQFATTPLKFWIPQEGGYKGINAPFSRHWKIADINADGRADLVLTSDPLTGKLYRDANGPYWRVYINVYPTQGGLASSFERWYIPDTPTSQRDLASWFNGPSGMVKDIDGDGRLDLVQGGKYDSANTSWLPYSDSVGTYWLVYRNIAAP